MGANDGPHPGDGEGPQRRVFVDPFAISPTSVTDAEFARFVAETGYRTEAEQAGSSFVFHALLADAADLAAPVQAPWWRVVPGASWRAPLGPGTSTVGIEDHPVTHVSLTDALAYCHWSGTRLPSEAEWEFAARGGLDGQPYPWGADLQPEGRHHCNIWQGTFPQTNTAEDGYPGTAPAISYTPNGFGLFNMVGNVWEWVADRFTERHSPREVKNPKGPLNGRFHVARGGSYLCHASYCLRYRTSSRQALMPNTVSGNLGFRVAACPIEPPNNE